MAGLDRASYGTNNTRGNNGSKTRRGIEFIYLYLYIYILWFCFYVYCVMKIIGDGSGSSMAQVNVSQRARKYI